MPRFVLVPLALSLTLLAAACGGGGGGSGSLDNADAAVVNGDHITRATLDRRTTEASCSYKLQKRTFPKPGSAEYLTIQSQILQNLVQRAELAQKAPSLKVSVTDKQVEDGLASLKKQYFGGSDKRYQAELKRQCVTDAEVREDLRSNLLSNAIFKKVTTDAKVTDAEVKAYYDTHRQVYTTPQTRVVSHILVKDKALADRLYTQLKGGADFAALAKRYSIDPGSKTQGGRLTITKGQTVPPFDKAAFELRTGALSKPVHTQYGWHIIHADKPATPHQSTPFSQVKESIKQQLLQQKRNGALQTWLAALKKEYENKVSYASGLAPAAAPTTTTG
ncbi:MAG TPA: peptidylprolyl isomerase [Gaiellaceae bacterium]|nr:peptidylprolyl isomerase [Gaiellaceae bacterium]